MTDISPLARIADLLDAYPELEETLIAQAPAFKRLRNPVLRRTVAKVATVEKAAAVAGIPVRDLVRTLRLAAGLDIQQDPGEAETDNAGADDVPMPGWVDRTKVKDIIDAEALLDAGEVPLTLAAKKARSLKDDQILLVTSTFRPVPLVAALENAGFRCHVCSVASEHFETFISLS